MPDLGQVAPNPGDAQALEAIPEIIEYGQNYHNARSKLMKEFDKVIDLASEQFGYQFR